MRPYREIFPHPGLARHVECFWYAYSAEAQTRLVLPDGCADLLLRLRGIPLSSNGTISSAEGAEVLFVGEMTRPLSAPNQARDLYLGVRFHPGMAHGLVKTSMHELTDCVVPLSALDKRLTSALVEPLWRAANIADTFSALERSLLKMHANGDDIHPALENALHLIRRNCGSISLTELARKTGYSARFLQKHFKESVGVGPKLLCRIVRFRHAARHLRRLPPGNLAQVALEFGYFDQAHFNHDFREFSGRTPGQISPTSS